MVILGWILCREFVKLYVERQSRRQGSRIKTKLVVGALTLSFVPVFFLVLFMYYAMNRDLRTWFREPQQNELSMFEQVTTQLGHEMTDETNAQAALLAAQPEVRQLFETGARTPGFLERFARQYELESAGRLRRDRTGFRAVAAGRLGTLSQAGRTGPDRGRAGGGRMTAASSRATSPSLRASLSTMAQTGQVIRKWAKEWSQDYQKYQATSASSTSC